MNWLKRNFAKIMSDASVRKSYIYHGTSFGDAASYLGSMGECIGFEDLLDEWGFWEKEVAKRGYKTFPVDSFIDAGGWGKPLPEITKRLDGENAIYHAELYRKYWLGRQTVTSFTNNGDGTFGGTYISPSTKVFTDIK